jgi:hypothetical protein
MEGKNRRHGRRANREMGRGRERPFGGRGCKINE